MRATQRLSFRPALSLLALSLSAAFSPAQASSHREAPFITGAPKVDATDFYLFNSYDPAASGLVAMIANYIPLQDAYGGPNYFTLDPNALYEIHVDNNGDGVEDITFQFRFKNTLKNSGNGQQVGGVSIPLRAIGPVAGSGGDVNNLSFDETYEVTAVYGTRRGGTRVAVKSGTNSTFTKPIDYIGDKTLGDAATYAAYAGQYIYNISFIRPDTKQACTGRVFVGQRKEAFSVNLGRIFDLVNAPASVLISEDNASALNASLGEFGELSNKNVTSLALEVNKECLLSTSGDPVVGGWTTASLRQARLINGKPGSGLQANENAGGAWAQVSRLGMPLVNEVVIGLKDKDKFNASKPANDASNFASYVLTPTLPGLLNALFGLAVPATPRNDIATIFLTGIPGVNKSAAASPVLSEMVRLNTGIASKSIELQSPLGVLGGDTSGFPNGRRPIDDVVDVSLRVVTGKLCGFNSAMACGSSASTTDPNPTVNLVDAVRAQNSSFSNSFPFLNTPLPGASNGSAR